MRHEKEVSATNSNNLFSYEIAGGAGLNESDVDIIKSYELLFNAFHQTILKCSVDEVGGFIIPIVYNRKENLLYRPPYNKGYSNIDMTAKQHTVNLLDMSPERGAYSVHFYGSHSNQIRIFIRQANIGLFYNNARLNDEDYNEYSIPRLCLTIATKMYHHDFYIQVKAQGLRSPIWLDFDVSNVSYIYKRALEYKAQNKLHLALIYIDEAISVIGQEHRDKGEYDYIYKEKTIINNLLQEQK